MNLNSFNFWVQLIVSLGFLVGMGWASIRTVAAFLRWWHNRLAETVAEDLKAIKAQTVPNGGSSLRDAIDRIEKNTNALAQALSQVKSDLDRHLGAHEGL